MIDYGKFESALARKIQTREPANEFYSFSKIDTENVIHIPLSFIIDMKIPTRDEFVSFCTAYGDLIAWDDRGSAEHFFDFETETWTAR